MKYTQGICGGGAAVLRDGEMIGIDEILSDLNKSSAAEAESRAENDALRERYRELEHQYDGADRAIELVKAERDQSRAEVERLTAIVNAQRAGVDYGFRDGAED